MGGTDTIMKKSTMVFAAIMFATLPIAAATETVTSIGNYAFYGCSGLTHVYGLEMLVRRFPLRSPQAARRSSKWS